MCVDIFYIKEFAEQNHQTGNKGRERVECIWNADMMAKPKDEQIWVFWNKSIWRHIHEVKKEDIERPYKQS